MSLQALLQVLNAQAFMRLARLAPVRDASAGEAMEPPGDCAQHTHHNERTQRLDDEEQAAQAEQYQRFSEQRDARLDSVASEQVHLGDDIANQVRRKSPPTRALPLGGGRGCWKARVPTENPDEPTRIRLAQYRP